MKVALLLIVSAIGIWYNLKATRHWWSVQKTQLPKVLDLGGWLMVALSGLWYFFTFAFFIGLTVNNTLFR